MLGTKVSIDLKISFQTVLVCEKNITVLTQWYRGSVFTIGKISVPLKVF